MAATAKRRGGATEDVPVQVLDEEEQERIISELAASWAATERWHRIALTVLGCVLVLLKLMPLSMPFVAHPAWDLLSAAIFALSIASLYLHRLVAIVGLAASGVLTLLWLPELSVSDYFTLIVIAWFGGLNLIYAGAAFHFRVTAASSAKEFRRLAELQFPCKQA